MSHCSHISCKKLLHASPQVIKVQCFLAQPVTCCGLPAQRSAPSCRVISYPIPLPPPVMRATCVAAHAWLYARCITSPSPKIKALLYLAS